MTKVKKRAEHGSLLTRMLAKIEQLWDDDQLTVEEYEDMVSKVRAKYEKS